jgi:methionyl-tRNA formyltransferase
MSGAAVLPAPPPRVLYLGYGACGRACLDALLAGGFEVVGVLCRASDRDPDGDEASSVFAAARRRGLDCLAATDPNAPNLVAAARRLAPDLLLSVQYDRILKPPLLAVPRHGAYNLHFGPLPRLRGCFPTKWAILDDEPAGVTLHAIDPGIDSGDVVARTVVPLATGETDETLYRKLERAAAALFGEQLPWMRELRPPPRRPQREEAATYHPKRLPFDGVIDWGRDAAWVERFVRAFTFPPHPAARTWWRGEEVQIRAPVGVGADLPGRAPGEIEPLGGGGDGGGSENEDAGEGKIAGEGSGAVAVACGVGSLRVERVLLGGEERPAAVLLRSGGRPAFSSRPPAPEDRP